VNLCLLHREFGRKLAFDVAPVPVLEEA
jgi:hypothetical protein